MSIVCTCTCYFTQNEKLTKKSGLFLNADKTEILNLGNNIEKVYEVEYMLPVSLLFHTIVS